MARHTQFRQILLKTETNTWLDQNRNTVGKEEGEILIIPRKPVIKNRRTMAISVQRTFQGAVFQAKVKEEERIGMRGLQGEEDDDLVKEARVLLQEELRATEEAGLVAPDLKVMSFEGKKLTGGFNNKGFLLQRWQLVDSEGARQVGFTSFQHAFTGNELVSMYENGFDEDCMYTNWPSLQ